MGSYHNVCGDWKRDGLKIVWVSRKCKNGEKPRKQCGEYLTVDGKTQLVLRECKNNENYYKQGFRDIDESKIEDITDLERVGEPRKCPIRKLKFW